MHEVPEAGVQDGLAEPVQWEERAEEEEKHGGGQGTLLLPKIEFFL